MSSTTQASNLPRTEKVSSTWNSLYCVLTSSCTADPSRMCHFRRHYSPRPSVDLLERYANSYQCSLHTPQPCCSLSQSLQLGHTHIAWEWALRSICHLFWNVVCDLGLPLHSRGNATDEAFQIMDSRDLTCAQWKPLLR